MTWLIAEDEADIRNLVALMCQAWGHIPLTFENGQKVWDWLDTIEGGSPVTVPELILMDIRMPGKKGNELARRMRQLGSLRGAPIVLMTAYTLSDNERQEMMTRDGVDMILAKPLPDFDQLRTILHNVGEKKKADNVGEPVPVAVQEAQKTAAAPVFETTITGESAKPESAVSEAKPKKKRQTGEIKPTGSADEQKQAEADNVGSGKQATS